MNDTPYVDHFVVANAQPFDLDPSTHHHLDPWDTAVDERDRARNTAAHLEGELAESRVAAIREAAEAVWTGAPRRLHAELTTPPNPTRVSDPRMEAYIQGYLAAYRAVLSLLPPEPVAEPADLPGFTGTSAALEGLSIRGVAA